MTGLNVQAPWASLLINGQKSVETRSYPLPKKYIGEELALVETPGKNGQFKSRIIGIITFSHSFRYPNEQAWKNDYARHGVSSESLMYSWDNKPKYGWVVSNINKFDEPIPVSKKKGIVFTTGIQL